MALTTAKWTLEDYHRMIAAGILAGRQVELLNGEIVEMAPEGEPHAYCSDEAGEYLTYLLGGRAKVRQGKPITHQVLNCVRLSCQGGRAKVRQGKPITLLQSNSEPEPDIAIVQRLGQDYRGHHPYPENIFWLIEYSESSLSKDLEVKSKIYAVAGMPEYWVINLRTMQLVVFRVPTNTGYQSKETLTQGDVNPLAFPDISISIGRLLGN